MPEPLRVEEAALGQQVDDAPDVGRPGRRWRCRGSGRGSRGRRRWRRRRGTGGSRPGRRRRRGPRRRVGGRPRRERRGGRSRKRSAPTSSRARSRTSALGATKAAMHDDPGLVDQAGDLGDAAQVLGALLGAEAEVAAHAEAQVLAVDAQRRPAGVEQAALEGDGGRGLAGAGQAGEEHGARALAVAALALVRGDLAEVALQVLVGLGVPARESWGRIIPAATVALVRRSMRMNGPGRAVALVGVEEQLLVAGDGAAADLVDGRGRRRPRAPGC